MIYLKTNAGYTRAIIDQNIIIIKTPFDTCINFVAEFRSEFVGPGEPEITHTKILLIIIFHSY